MLEVVWTRLLRLVFGSTTLAVSTILVAYMLGLGVGSLVGGRVAKRLGNGVRVYGQMELGIAAYALAVPALFALFPLLNRVGLASLSFWPAALGRFVVVLLALLVPTMLMGATLPVLVGALVRDRRALAARVGLLYGLNTLGAVCGVFLSTFVLLPMIGVRWTNWTAALLDGVVGMLALWRLAPRLVAAPAVMRAALPASPDAARSPAALAWWSPPLLAYGIVGFTALTFEVCWTRVLALVLGSSVYAFATMLAAFLTGIAFGSLLGRRWFDRLRAPMAVYAAGLGTLGLLSLGTLLLIARLPDLFVRFSLQFGLSPTGVVATSVITGMLVMLAPTLVLGALFPLVIRAIAPAQAEHSRVVGDVYFINTIGSALGSFLTGFLFIPLLGLRMTLALAMAFNLVAAGAVVLWQTEWGGRLRPALAAVSLAAAALLLAFPPQWDQAALTRGVYRDPLDQLDVGVELLPLLGMEEDRLLYYRDGINTTVSVHRKWGDTLLRVNGKVDASTGRDMPTQVLAGELPMLFGAPAARVLAIGLASGVTVGSLALHAPVQLDVAELEPTMVDVVHFFDDVNHRPLANPAVHVIAADGRTYVANLRAQYDVIVSEPSNPWITGAASLFTREFFQAARQALRPGGRLLQWVQLYGFDARSLRALLAALHAEFPYVYGFAQQAGAADLLLLATEAPLGPELLPHWEGLSEPVRDDLRRVNTFSTADLWSLLQFTPSDVEALLRDAPEMNRDDNMLVELAAPWALHDDEAINVNWKLLSKYSSGVLPIAEVNGRTLDADTVGALGLSYADARLDGGLATRLSEVAERRGGSVDTQVTHAVLTLAKNPEAVAAARALLDAAVARAPEAFAPRLHRARLLHDAGLDTEALADIDMAQQAAPDDLRLRDIRLAALVALGRAAEARDDAVALLASPYAQLDPDVNLLTARTAVATQNMDDGIREILRYLERNPYSPDEWKVLAAMYEHTGRPAEAAVAHSNTELARRDRVLFMHRLARRAARRGAVDDAISDLKATLDFDPTYVPARDDLRQLTGG